MKTNEIKYIKYDEKPQSGTVLGVLKPVGIHNFHCIYVWVVLSNYNTENSWVFKNVIIVMRCVTKIPGCCLQYCRSNRSPHLAWIML